MAATATAVIFSILALVELATDKHPDAPIRTTLGLLTARVALGALSGAALGVASHPYALGGYAARLGRFLERLAGMEFATKSVERCTCGTFGSRHLKT